MQRVRRLVLLAVLAVAGAVVLTGCGRAEPGVAAYVGDKQFSTDEVDSIVADANREARSEFRANGEAVVQLLIMDELATALLREKNLQVEEVPVSAIAEAVGMAPGSRYVQLWTSVIAKQYALERAAKPTTLTDAELMLYYNAGVEGGAFRAGVPVAEVREALAADDRTGRLIAVHNEIGARVRSADVVVNPRYGRPAQPILMPNQNGGVDKLTLAFESDPNPAVRA